MNQPKLTGDTVQLLYYSEVKQAAARYRDTAKMHSNCFWAVYLLSAANMIDALCDQSERRFEPAARPMINIEGEGDNKEILAKLIPTDGWPVEAKTPVAAPRRPSIRFADDP